MKLCFLTGEYPPMQGGVADHTAHLAQHLGAADAEVLVLTSSRAQSGSTATSGPGQVHAIIERWGPGCWPRIERFLKQHSPDVLHIQYQAAAFDLAGWVNWLPWWLQRKADRPRLVVTFHDLRVPYLFPKAGRLRQQAILSLARYTDAVITTNAEDEYTLRRHAWATHVRRIPLGSNVEPQPPTGYDRRAWRERLGVDEGQTLLAYFGFLNQSKGGQELILALDDLIQRGYDAHLLMIGAQVGDVDPTNRQYYDQVQTLIRQRELEQRVHWTGHVSQAEVSANLLAADVVVMPYRDGVSFRRTTFIAALRHGCPVVTTLPAFPLEELRDGDNVLLTPPQDVTAVSDGVIRLIDDPALRSSLSASARTLGRQFDWSHIASQTRDVYRRLGL
jgi:glycosyltransferase involved in cell wall biosynthesis